MIRRRIRPSGAFLPNPFTGNPYVAETGTGMQIMEYGGIVYLIPPVDDPIRAACGALSAEPSLAEKLLRDRKKEFH